MLTASHIFIRWDIAFLKDADSRRPCHAHGREARCCPRLRGGIIHVTIIRVHGTFTPLATAGVATTRKGWADYDLHDRKALPANRTKLSESYGTFWLVGTGSPISLISSCWAKSLNISWPACLLGMWKKIWKLGLLKNHWLPPEFQGSRPSHVNDLVLASRLCRRSQISTSDANWRAAAGMCRI